MRKSQRSPSSRCSPPCPRRPSPVTSTQAREEAAARAVELIGEVIPEAFAGDAHAFLVAVYKDPTQERHARQDAAKAALPYEKSRPVTVTLANASAVPLKVRSALNLLRSAIAPSVRSP